ncbi:hypothetical protein [Sphingomonas sp. MM-1]|uniref:hypothetical protein n=1 Tax=Sphingomonas sp. MM-1 TaxID=745310 RepID=UPI000B32D00F|nr:hypothetical protein [Sphingomonas sp. MM-1]
MTTPVAVMMSRMRRASSNNIMSLASLFFVPAPFCHGGRIRMMTAGLQFCDGRAGAGQAIWPVSQGRKPL